MDKEEIAFFGFIVAGLFSITVAVLNLVSTRSLHRKQKEFDLIKRDLDKLDELVSKINQIELPPSLSPEDFENKSDDDINIMLQQHFDEISPGFMKITGLMLQYTNLFPENIQKDIVQRYRAAVESKDGNAIVKRHEFMAWAPSVVVEQISAVRSKWLG